MPTMLVRNISEDVHDALKKRAKEHGTSAEAEVRAILRDAVSPTQEEGLGTRIHRIFTRSGVFLPEIERRKELPEPAVFD